MLNLTAADKKLLNSAKAELIGVAHTFYQKNWSLATSGNFSVVICREPFNLLITASGKDKQVLDFDDFVLVDQKGDLVSNQGSSQKQSAETLLHTTLACDPEVGAVLHTHSITATLLSQKYCKQGYLDMQGYEMIKAINLSGQKVTHETSIRLPIFENSQDMTALSSKVKRSYAALPKGFLISGHGLYAWGKDLAEAKRHIEGYEFLLEVVRQTQE